MTSSKADRTTDPHRMEHRTCMLVRMLVPEQLETLRSVSLLVFESSSSQARVQLASWLPSAAKGIVLFIVSSALKARSDVV